MEHSKLLRKIALSFSLSTGLEFDDLYQEANLAYLEALRTHDATKGKITTYLWHCVHNRLKNYLKQEREQKTISIEDVTEQLSYSSTSFWEYLPKEAMEIVKVVLASPNEFDLPYWDQKQKVNMKFQKETVKKIRTFLFKNGWDMKKIFTGIKELQQIYS